MMRYQLCRALNSLLILTLSFTLIASFIFQFRNHHIPCLLCEMQRLMMLIAAIGAFLNIRINLKPLHYALIILAGIFGGSIALGQAFLHACKIPITSNSHVLGLELYTWSFIVFISTIVVASILLLLYQPQDSEIRSKSSLLEKLLFSLILIVSSVNVLITINICGLGLCR